MLSSSVSRIIFFVISGTLACGPRGLASTSAGLPGDSLDEAQPASSRWHDEDFEMGSEQVETSERIADNKRAELSGFFGNRSPAIDGPPVYEDDSQDPIEDRLVIRQNEIDPDSPAFKDRRP